MQRSEYRLAGFKLLLDCGQHSRAKYEHTELEVGMLSNNPNSPLQG